MVKKFYMDTKKGTLQQSVLDVWKDAAELEESPDGRTKSYKEHRKKLESARTRRESKKTTVKTEQPETEHGAGEESYELGTDRYADYTNKITPGQMEEQVNKKSLEDTVINMWKEAASAAVDPNEREELDGGKNATGEGGKKTAAKMKRADEPKPMIASEETEELDEKLTAKQKKIDVDGDGEIEGSDLAKLRKKAKKEGRDELELAKELKNSSMREAIRKVWEHEDSNEEGYNPYGKKKMKKEDDEEEKSTKDNKTLTGKKAATVDLEPNTKP